VLVAAVERMEATPFLALSLRLVVATAEQAPKTETVVVLVVVVVLVCTVVAQRELVPPIRGTTGLTVLLTALTLLEQVVVLVLLRLHRTAATVLHQALLVHR
jgi:hypothetical protein